MTEQGSPAAAGGIAEGYDALIVGAGLAGMYALHRLRRGGARVLAFEAGSGVGGTWYWNRYPGARCDVESIDYSYSFDEQLQDEWRWTERYATQPEILAYLEHVADRFDLRRDIRLDTRVEAASYDEGTATWTVTTDAGETYRSRYVILATGSLSVPVTPDIPGVETFAGDRYFTARWPQEGVDFTGRRVAVIGTGSSGIQASPVIAETAASLTVFQRTPNFSIPAFNRFFTEEEQARIRQEYPERRRKSRASGGGSPFDAYHKKAIEADEDERYDVYSRAWERGGVLFGKAFPDQTTDPTSNAFATEFVANKIRETVHDPVTADDLIPKDHPIGTKRICTDSGYFEMYNRDNVRLVNLRREPIVEIYPDGIRTAAGEYPVDAIVFATGFDAMTGALLRLQLVGKSGRRIQDVWADGPLTHLGMTIPSFPNLFVLNGPGSTSVLANMFLTAEHQVDWIVELLDECARRGVREIEADRAAAEEWTERVSEVAHQTLFVQANSWYLGANIEGKRRVFMPFIGGFATYQGLCDDVRQRGYAGLVLRLGDGD